MTINTDRREDIELVWGATEIGRVINRSPRSTYHMLERGDLPAKKVGGKWVAERGQLHRLFLETA